MEKEERLKMLMDSFNKNCKGKCEKSSSYDRIFERLEKLSELDFYDCFVNYISVDDDYWYIRTYENYGIEMSFYFDKDDEFVMSICIDDELIITRKYSDLDSIFETIEDCFEDWNRRLLYSFNEEKWKNNKK